MNTLAKGKCEPCRKGAPKVTAEEMEALKPQVPEWAVLERDGEQRLERVFEFPDFAKALAFTNTIGAIAEEQGHHPALLTEWGRVTVGWWTHKIGGLHRNDFVMAARTDEAFAEIAGRATARRTDLGARPPPPGSHYSPTSPKTAGGG